MKYFSLVFRALPAVAVAFLLAVVPFHAHAVVYNTGNDGGGGSGGHGRGMGHGHTVTAPPCSGGSPQTGAPIDGGASLLLASGVAFAVRRVRQARLVRKATR